MDKGDAMASASDSRGLVDQPDALGTEVSEGVLDVGDGEGDMMEALAPAFEEAADRGLWGEGLKQLNGGAADGDHCLFHALLGDHLAAEGLAAVLIAELVE